MTTDWDVYCAFRKAQANANNRGYRLPKDWKACKAKMTAKNVEWLDEATKHFNTRLSNIDIDRYMECGFDLWKGFTYKQFLNDKVIEHYIHKDKIQKRKLDISRTEIDRTFAFIQSWMADKPLRPGYGQLQSFCKFRDGQIRAIVSLYNLGKIDALTFTYCLMRKYIVFDDDERALTPYITQRYRELLENLKPLIGYIKSLEDRLNEQAVR